LLFVLLLPTWKLFELGSSGDVGEKLHVDASILLAMSREKCNFITSVVSLSLQ